MEDTVDKFDLRKHMHFRVQCLSASWDQSKRRWTVSFKDLQTGHDYIRTADVLVSAVGGISHPRDIRFVGMEKYKGEMFHTARWNHKVQYEGKRVAVIGNGCSAAQVVPALVKDASFVKQYARSAQWYHERPNRNFTPLEKWCFKHVPLWERYLRLRLFLANDSLVATYMPGPAAARLRKTVEAHAKQYICKQAPQKYHQALVPDFPLGE
jgi:cation diffusion facilitator CzcD-associated flavoprotein CzcO